MDCKPLNKMTYFGLAFLINVGFETFPTGEVADGLKRFLNHEYARDESLPFSLCRDAKANRCIEPAPLW